MYGLIYRSLILFQNSLVYKLYVWFMTIRLLYSGVYASEISFEFLDRKDRQPIDTLLDANLLINNITQPYFQIYGDHGKSILINKMGGLEIWKINK